MKYIYKVIPFVCLALFFYACELACTDELRMIGVTVMAPEEEDSVFLDQIIITEKRTGKLIDLCDFGDHGHCSERTLREIPDYGIAPIIFHDGIRKKIKRRRAMEILVEGFRDSLSFQQEFVIGYDGCHVFKAAGPDTVYLQPAAMK